MRRSAFTLIEMLVVIAIIVVLATLSVAIIPSVQQRTKATRGADQTQGWLLIARERALRDHAPRGVRLLVDLDGYVRSMVFIEQPDPFTGGVLTVDTNTPNTYNHVTFSNPPDVTGGLGAANNTLWPIQPGDYLQIQGGTSFVIQSIDLPKNGVYTTNAIWSTAVAPPVPAPNYQTSNYLITRSPRQTADDVLRLPDDVVIDTAPHSLPYPWLSQPAPLIPPGAPYVDILFTPSGALTGSLGNSNGKIVLWLRDLTKDFPLPPNPQASTGDQPLLVIYTRTGRTAAVQFNTDLNVPAPGQYDPYFYVYDPRNAGL